MKQEEVEKKEEKNVQQKAVKVEEKKKVIQYIGPTIPKVVTEARVFNNGLPKELEEEIKKCPAIRSLLLPIDKLIKARQELEQKNSALQLCYEKVAQYVREKGES